MAGVVELVVVGFCCAAVVFAAWMGTADTREPARGGREVSAVFANGREFRRVPVGNLHRLRGRHRA